MHLPLPFVCKSYMKLSLEALPCMQISSGAWQLTEKAASLSGPIMHLPQSSVLPELWPFQDMQAGREGAHIESAQVVRVHHALAAVLSEGLPGAVGVVLHRVLPAAPVPPQINLQHAASLLRPGMRHGPKAPHSSAPTPCALQQFASVARI